MRLLLVTQAIDVNDPVLGFFHAWVRSLASQFAKIEVICLKKGEHALPDNVSVRSLGKEKGDASPLQYAQRFLSYITDPAHPYDAVFVHMNPEYLMLGALFWKMHKKPVNFWYNHPKAGLRLSIALVVADRVFHTSPYAASARSKKAIRMPAGIDTQLFAPSNAHRTAHTIYMQGRIMASKRVDVACESVGILLDRGVPVTLTVVGPDDTSFAVGLKEKYAQLITAGAITFLGAQPHHQTPHLFSTHAVSLNLASGGHYDKTVLESAACETPVIVGSDAFKGIVPSEWVTAITPEALADTLERFCALTTEAQAALGASERTQVVAKESLPALIERLSREIHAGYPLP